VLKHLDDYHAALSEVSRVGGLEGSLLLGLPFRQAIHNAPLDYWRFADWRSATGQPLLATTEVLSGAERGGRGTGSSASSW
jgi:hypothetical protein